MTSDSVALLKLIQTVGLDNTIPCDQRIAYLLELHGRLRAAIEIKGFLKKGRSKNGRFMSRYIVLKQGLLY